MTKLKVRMFGSSLGVVLPKEGINCLQTKDGQSLFLVEGPNGTYRLTAYDPAFEKKMAKAEDIMRRYRNTLHVLAKRRNQSGLTSVMRSRICPDKLAAQRHHKISPSRTRAYTALQ